MLSSIWSGSVGDTPGEAEAAGRDVDMEERGLMLVLMGGNCCWGDTP